MSRTPPTEVPVQYAELHYLAARLYQAGNVFPADVKSEHVAFAVLLAGHELGFAPMASARAFAVVKGKISLSAQGTVAVCVRHRDVCRYFRCVSSSPKEATYETHREGAPEPVRLTWTLDQAKRSNLDNGPTWKAHPEAMLRARCSAALARDVYPDLVGGLYIEDEAVEADAQTDPTSPGALFAALRIDLAEVSTLAAARAVWQARDAQFQSSGVASDAADIVRDHLGAVGYSMLAADFRAALAGTLNPELEAVYDALAKVYGREGDDDFALAIADVVGVLRAMPKTATDPLKKSAFAAARARLEHIGMSETDSRAALTAALKPPKPQPDGGPAPAQPVAAPDGGPEAAR